MFWKTFSEYKCYFCEMLIIASCMPREIEMFRLLCGALGRHDLHFRPGLNA